MFSTQNFSPVAWMVCWLVLGSALPTAWALDVSLPDIGASSEQTLSNAEEEKLGREIIHTLRQEAPLLEDPEVMQYLNELGYRLASHSANPSQPFHFFVIQDDSINAFATPGGVIAMFSGLILRSHTESELASVVAHEIAHVTQHHIARRLEATSRWSPAMIGVMLASLLLASQNPEVAQAGVMAATAGRAQLSINFTRAYEREADRVGMETLRRAGLDPLGMPTFFERLQQKYRYAGGAVPEFLRSHPVTTDRIAEAKDRADKLRTGLLKDNPAFHLMKAKVLNLTTDNPEALAKRLRKSLETGQYLDERAVRYGLVLALLNSRQTQGVAKHLAWLGKQDEDRVIYRTAAARLAALQGHATQAQQIYQKALQIYPNDAVLSMAYANFLQAQQQPAEAERILSAIQGQKWPDYYRQLAQVQQANGHDALSRLSLAELYVLNGQLALAIEQLKQARTAPIQDYHVASRIEERLQTLEAEWQAEKNENGTTRREDNEEPPIDPEP